MSRSHPVFCNAFRYFPCHQIHSCIFWKAAAISAELLSFCCSNCPEGSAWNRLILMRSVCFWDIRFLMSSALSRTGDGITPAVAAGSPTAIRKKHRHTSTFAASTLPGIVHCTLRALLFCSLLLLRKPSSHFAPRFYDKSCCLNPRRHDLFASDHQKKEPRMDGTPCGANEGKKEISIKNQDRSGLARPGCHHAASLRPSSRQASCASASGASFTVRPSSS